MKHKRLLSIAAVFAFFAASGSVWAFTMDQLQFVRRSGPVQQVTFWGRPFPYGYNWSLVRACTRYLPVETAQGTRLQRVWVCRAKWRHYSW